MENVTDIKNTGGVWDSDRMKDSLRLNRSQIRDLVFKLLYISEFKNAVEMEWQISALYGSDLWKCDAFELEDESVESKEIDWLDFENEENEPEIPDDEDVDTAVERFRKVKAHIAEEDEMLSQFSTGWKLERMSRVDRNILRLAVYELVFDDSIPTGVAINEAVELAKRYGGSESQVFVNGLLGKLAKEKEI